MTDFKSFIMDARKRSGLSQVKYARLLGVTDKSFANWERGDTTPIEWRQTEIVAKIEELERAGPVTAEAGAVAASGDIEFSEEPAETPANSAVSIPATSDEEPKMNKPALVEPAHAAPVVPVIPPSAQVPAPPAAFPKVWPDSWGIRRA